MKRSVLYFTMLLYAFTAQSQQVFFRSAQSFSKEQLATFYSSVNIRDSLVLFNAADYRVYAYNKNTGQEKWRYQLGRKSDIPPFFAGDFIWASTGKDVVKLEPGTGQPVKTCQGITLETQPVLKNGILYFTGIYDGGCLLAYDTKADSVVWKRFLAHGVSKTPYYQADKIIANAEGDNWIEVNYDGTLKAPGCDTGEDILPLQAPCAKQFFAITHDGKEIKGKLAEALSLNEFSTPDVYINLQNTFFLLDGHLTILGNKLKKKSSVLLATLADNIADDNGYYTKLLKEENGILYLLYNNQLMAYRHRDKKLLQTLDLSEWEPHQALLDENKLWLISGKDGLLYGLSVN